MTNTINTEGLPPEMQARIADIIEKAKATAIQPQAQAAPQQQAAAAPALRPPSLMDHTIALRHPIGALRQELHAAAQVIEAVGNAVGELYGMFQQQTQPTSFSAGFQETQQGQVDEY